MNVRKELKDYIENEIFKVYNLNEKRSWNDAHKICN